MLNLLRRILGRKYHFLNQIEISKNNLNSNYNYLSSLDKNLQIAPVLKSNAYGHGLVLIAKILEKSSPPFFCVDSLHEAYQLYNSGIKTPILIMGYIDPENLRVKRLPFAYAVYNLDYLKKIHQYQPHAEIHLKVDTGMHRMGILIDELENLLKAIALIPDLKIGGLMSHLATIKGLLFNLQLNNFIRAKNLLAKYGFTPPTFHVGASEAILDPHVRSEMARVSNIIRAGKSLYGISTHTQDNNLRPVLKLTSKIAQIKKIKKGDLVGYDGTFTAKNDMQIAILPIGYFDGVDRRLSNRGSVMVGNTNCKIIGRVSMNITTIDISNVKNPKINQQVEIFSNQQKDPNSIFNIAKICDTIPHEILIHLDSSITRVVK